MSIKLNKEKSASRSILTGELSRFLRRAAHDQPGTPKGYSHTAHAQPGLAMRKPAMVPREISRYEVLGEDRPISNLQRIHQSCPPQTTSLQKLCNTPETTTRRFSWLPFRKSNLARTEISSQSVSVSGTESMLFVAESATSSPVLTSPTNTHIEKREIVRCSKMNLSNHSIQTKSVEDNSQRGQYGLDASGEWKSGPRSMVNTQVRLTSALQGVRQKIKHVRRASTSLLLENTWPRHLGENNSVPAARADVSNGGVSSSVRHRNQGKNYMLKDELGENPWPSLGSSSLAFLKRCPSEQDKSRYGQAPCLPLLQSGSTIDLLTGSLSELFTNATNKFDVQAIPPPQSFAGSSTTFKLKNVRSYFSLHSVSSELSKTVDEEKATSKPHIAIDLRNQSALRGRQQGNLLTAINKTLNTQAQKPTIASSKPVQLRFCGKKNHYIRGKSDSTSPHGVNPLRMHPEVYTLAYPPSERAFPSTPNHKPRRDSSDDDGSETIDCAIIYSPSTGNLSEYSRKTSSPTLKDGLRQGRAQQETPTRKPLHKRSCSVLKRSVSSFITKSTSLMRLGNLTPSRKFKLESNTSALAKCASHPEQYKLVNESSPDARMRGRAMSSPNLCCSEGLRAVWDYQPSTPSPLRKTTKMSDVSRGRPRAVMTNTPVDTLADRKSLLEERRATSGTHPKRGQGQRVLADAENVNGSSFS